MAHAAIKLAGDIATLIAIVVGVPLCVLIILAKPPSPYRGPLDTEADVRPVLDQLLRERVRSFPKFMVINDLQQQIRNVRVGPATQDTEPATARFVEFDLDTGCGEVISVSSFMRSRDGQLLSPSSHTNCP